MNKFQRSVAAVVLCALTLAPANAEQSNSPMDGYRYLVGRWHCTFSVGPTRGVYTTTWAETLGGRWLQQTMVQPSTQRSMMNSYGSAEPGFRATFLVGYDRDRSAWVRFGALSTGQYFAMRMASVSDGSWAWTYVSFFRSRSASNTDATLRKMSPTRYVIDGPTYPDEVTKALVTERHTCTKA